ncbi:MAG: hypothetical protein ACTHU0_12700, partial [Kofleriaceae bacterium]
AAPPADRALAGHAAPPAERALAGHAAPPADRERAGHAAPPDRALAGHAAPRVIRRAWPAEVRLVPFFTGRAADTATLVAAVSRARAARPAAVDAALAAIAEASRAACAALAAPPALATSALLGAFSLAANATDRLALATGVELVPPCVIAARSELHRLGGTAKTTGAGGGDVGVAVLPASIDGTVVTRALIEAGCQPLALSLEETGVDTRTDPQ